MKWFRKKPPQTDGASPASRPAHRFTRDLARAESLAVMLANTRASQVIEVSDLLAGMYIDNWERLSRYWPDVDAVELFLRDFCRITPSRLQYWIQYYDELRRSEERRHFFGWSWFRRRKAPLSEKTFERSGELEAALRAAEAIAPYRDSVGERPIPILTTECVLLAIAKNGGSEIGRRLVESGLDVRALERAARFPKHAPLR